MVELIYPFWITFLLVFFAELGDKTQLLVLSFSTKNKLKHILLGIAVGTFFSHGLAILFGSHVACISDSSFQFYLKIFTYASFLVLGVIGFLPNKKNKSENENSNKPNLLKRFSFLNLNCVFMVALLIFVGELGDKTFLASLSLGLAYPYAKFSLILGSILGMVASNFLVIFSRQVAW